MRACRSFSVLFFVAFLPGLIMAQATQENGKVYQQAQLQDLQRQNSESQSTSPQQRPATPAERAEMNRIIQQQQQQSTNPAAAGVAPNVNYAPQLPKGFPLPPDQEKYVSDLLDYWQQSSQQVKRSTCDFTRRDYSPDFCDYRDPRNNHLVPHIMSLGKIHFAAPDNGRYETDEVWDFKAPPEKVGEEPIYEQRDINENREKWICDGKAIYQFDYANKRLNETKIPPEMQGKGLANTPLPFFLFGADKKMILERYWIRPATPPGVEDAYWLEAHPKRVADARVYKKLEIIISRDDFLPSSLVMYLSNYDPVKNPVSRSFEFTNRKVNSHLDAILDFFSNFRRPPTPIGWKRVDIKPDVAANQPAVPDSSQSGPAKSQENSVRR